MILDAEARAFLRGVHMQIVGMQTHLAALDHQVRTALGPETKAEPKSGEPPAKVAEVSAALREVLGKPTLQEQRGNVFMRPPQAVEVPELQKPTASGTPTGVSAVHVPS